jgi:RHS repeat-associated protein
MSRAWRAVGLLLVSLTPVAVRAQTATPWQSGAYGYDGAGNIKSIGSEQFAYDALGRLVSGTAGVGRTQTAAYDGFGNITTLTTDGVPVSFGVDPATNRTSRAVDPVTGQGYNAYGSYDEAGRLKTTLGGFGDAFSYDAVDMVSRNTVSGVTKVHIYSVSDERIASLTVSNGAEVRSEWTLRDASGKVLRLLEKNGSNWTWKEDYIHHGQALLAAEDSTGQTLHFFPDHLGSPRLITGKGGMKVAAHTYFPFGEEATSPAQESERMKFTGHERDAETLDYMHARYYFPKWGRFLSVDPTWESADLGKPQSWNRYSYVMNNPVNMTDPDGKCPICIDPKELALATYATAAEFVVDYVIADGDTPLFESGYGTNADKPDLARPVVAGAIVTTQSGDEILTRRTAHESTNRLAKRAADAEKKTGIHGVSASASPLKPDGAAKASRSEVEKVFKVHNTPSAADPLHRTVELPKPVTNRITRIFNRIFRAL